MKPFAVGIKPLKKISCHEYNSCPEYVYPRNTSISNEVDKMNTDSILMNSDIILTDKNGNKIDITPLKPEFVELWV